MWSRLQTLNALDLSGTHETMTRLHEPETITSQQTVLQSRRLALSTTFPNDNTLWEIEDGDLNDKLAIEGVIMPASCVIMHRS